MDAADNAKSFQNSKEPLGEILVKRGKVTTAQLSDALARQAKAHKLLGEILVSMKVLEEEDIVAALVMQCGVPYLAVNKYDIPAEVLKLIPESKVREHCLLPVDQSTGVLSVVMADPLRQEVILQLGEITRFKIIPFIATKTEIEKAITRYYGSRAG